jgi:beta-galactosidase beta subunit
MRVYQKISGFIRDPFAKWRESWNKQIRENTTHTTRPPTHIHHQYMGVKYSAHGEEKLTFTPTNVFTVCKE